MESICGANCDSCGYGKICNCNGCRETEGCPFDKQCFIAQYIRVGGIKEFNAFKEKIIAEFNDMKIDGMPRIEELVPLNGAFANLEYPMPNGERIKLLDNDDIYLGTQVECEFNDEEMTRCYGLVAGIDFLLVSEYGINGSNPELIIYKKR